MPKSLDSIRDELLALSPLSDGYRIECDRRTDNLLVRGPTLAFCVTRKAIEDGYYIPMYSPSLDALIAAENSGATMVDLPPIEREYPNAS